MVFQSIGLTRQYLFVGFPLVGFALGWYLDRAETDRLVSFRDRSALYGRQLKDGEAPSWP